MKVLNNLDLVKNELRNARVQNLASAPASPVEGQIYHNTTDHALYYYDGTAWVKVDDTWVASVSASAPIVSTGGVTPTISIVAATTSVAGSMSSSDKTKLDGATSDATASTLAIRDGSGTFKVSTPTDTAHPATKAYVDSYVQGLDAKASARAATTANITLSGAQTIDGVAVVATDRVLVKNQTVDTANGIYVAAAGAWVRADDANTSALLSPGTFIFVEEGTLNGDAGYVMTADAPVTLGTTSLTWVQFSGAGQVVAGAGLTKSNNTIDAVGTSNRITVAADSIDISTSYVGQATITTLGTVATGTWQGTAVGVAYGGTGATSASAARANLDATTKVSATVTGSGTTHTVTHNLNTRDITVQVYEAVSPYAQVFPDLELVSVNAVDVKFSVAPGSDSYRVVVIG